MEKEILGYKYETYEGDAFKLYRTIGFKDYHTVIALDLDSGEKVNITKQDLLDRYIRLIPDAFMNIMITDLDVAPDVYLCINKSTNLNNGKKEPDIILRQNVYSPYSDAFNITPKISIGACITENICSGETTMASFMEFDKIKYSDSVALYVDDTVDDIINIINPRTIKHINSALQRISYKYSSMPYIEGCTDNIKSLMEDTNFIFYYRNIFNILQLDWQIDIGKESYNDNGDLAFNDKQQKRFEDEIRKFICNIKVIKYDKDIDISRVVSYTHTMVSDITQTIYLIAYDVLGDYPVDADIAQAMKH